MTRETRDRLLKLAEDARRDPTVPSRYKILANGLIYAITGKLPGREP